MADIRKLIQTGPSRDTMRTAFPILNMVIDSANESLNKANEAKADADYAVQTADIANSKSDSTQTQLDTIIIESGTSDAEVIQARVDAESNTFNTLQERLNNSDMQLTENANNLRGRGMNLRALGAVLDGVTDEYDLVMSALTEYKHVIIPSDGVLATSQMIRVTQGQSLTCPTDNIRGYGQTATIKYIGPLNRKQAVIVIGRNLVGNEPSLDGTDIQLKNIFVDANNLCGIGVYGTYLTNETSIENVATNNTLEYGMYFAKSWYAKYHRLISLGSQGQGIALGMPLEWLDGTSVTWTGLAPYEMNGCTIKELRSINAGKYFSVDNPNTYNPADISIRRKGYGVGIGIGNSMNVEYVVSEKSGGQDLYVYNGFQPVKTISKVYLENGCYNSGLDPETTKSEIIIENVNATGSPIFIRDCNININSGGIYFTGVLGRKVWLDNVHEPKFLKSLDGLTTNQLYAEVLKRNVYFGAGQYNTLESIAKGIDVIQMVNTRYSFTVNTKQTVGFKLIFIKSEGGTPWGSYTLNYADGTTATRNFPAGMGSSYVLSSVANGNLTSITKAGGTGAEDINVTFKIVDTPNTFI
jgi:hypothetical protein